MRYAFKNACKKEKASYFCHDAKSLLRHILAGDMVTVKQKSQHQMSRQKLILFQYYHQQWGTEHRSSGDNQLCWHKGWEVFKCQGELVEKCWKVLVTERLINGMYWACWIIPEFASVFSVIRSSAFASWWPSKQGHYPSQSLGDRVLSPSVFTVRRDSSQVLGKDFSWVVNVQEAGGRFISQKGK